MTKIDLNAEGLRKLNIIRTACLTQVADLIAAARLLDDNGQPHLSYHMATLALEEIGKYELSKMSVFRAEDPDTEDEESTPLSKGGDDHVRKLFWALWAPLILRGKGKKEEVEELRGLARDIHERRLRGLYVEIGEKGVSSPRSSVSAEQLKSLIALAEARYESEKISEIGESPSTDAQGLIDWFLSMKDDAEASKIIFGQASIAKLGELNNPRAWISWLKEQIDSLQATSNQMITEELSRKLPSQERRHDPKWKITVRVHTSTHSIRPKPLGTWNAAIEMFKLHPVAGHKDQLDINMFLPSGVHVSAVFEAGKIPLRFILLALNIATVGVFWTSLPIDPSRVFTKIEDLERPGAELKSKSTGPPEQMRRAMKDAELNRVVAILTGLLSLKITGQNPFEHYFSGLAFLMKSDSFFDFNLPALQAFSRALRSGVLLLGGITEDEQFPGWLDTFLKELVPEEEARKRIALLILNSEKVENIKPPVTPDEAGSIKVICDTYFNQAFAKRMRDKAEELKGSSTTS